MRVKKDYDNLEQTLVLKTVRAYERLYYTGKMNGGMTKDEYELIKDQFYTLKGMLSALYDVPDTSIIWRAIASFYKSKDYDCQRPAEIFYRHVVGAFELWKEFEREEQEGEGKTCQPLSY